MPNPFVVRKLWAERRLKVRHRYNHAGLRRERMEKLRDHLSIHNAFHNIEWDRRHLSGTRWSRGR